MTMDSPPTTTWAYVPISSSTNLGAMVTPMVFASDCTNIYKCNTPFFGQPTWSALYTGGCVMSSCCPFSKIYTTAYGWYSSYYSPAVCPQNYITCNGPWEVQSSLPRNEHVRFCCPSGYPSPLWPGYEICATLRLSATTGLLVNDITSQMVYSTETLAARTLSSTVPYEYAYPLQIRWKDSDFITALTTGGGGGIPTTTASSSTLRTGAPSSPTETSSSGLSMGATVATAVVVSVVGTVINMLAVLWAWRRRSKRASEARNLDQGEGPHLGWASPRTEKAVSPDHGIPEAASRPLHELPQ